MPDNLQHDIADDELQPEETPKFKVGEKKTLDEYQKLDEDDPAMRKWKESLGLGTGTDLSDPKDPRTVIIFSLGLEVEGRPDIIINLTEPKALENLKNKPFVIKEGATFRMKVRFKVQHQILSGLKYVQVVKKVGVSNKLEEMIGSYSPNTTDRTEYEKKFEPITAPSTMAKGLRMFVNDHYDAVSKFIDDDNQTHLKFQWSFDIKKDWQ
ncbi:E set domain-containing protein [Eremomyces bilateralis CBS 781.70]|uniref:E set domain-containing protein n=1 Tax=Eremomyces bilateralis CBS 781.70 TaxID=1392243 RepID=A0A6G1GFC7_9PEZI|nr:E set domain-containing protein [Eremomyces bilateralis CBS 781.70]KAF1816815.1 E set domain-containing protein [Eremomyces bilateralis CBS 781.70]